MSGITIFLLVTVAAAVTSAYAHPGYSGGYGKVEGGYGSRGYNVYEHPYDGYDGEYGKLVYPGSDSRGGYNGYEHQYSDHTKLEGGYGDAGYNRYGHEYGGHGYGVGGGAHSGTKEFDGRHINIAGIGR